MPSVRATRLPQVGDFLPQVTGPEKHDVRKRGARSENSPKDRYRFPDRQAALAIHDMARLEAVLACLTALPDGDGSFHTPQPCCSRAHLDNGPFTLGQRDAVALILSVRDRTVGVQGYASTGKGTGQRSKTFSPKPAPSTIR